MLVLNVQRVTLYIPYFKFWAWIASELLLLLKILSRCRPIYGFRLHFSCVSIKLVMVFIMVWLLNVLFQSYCLFGKTMRSQRSSNGICNSPFKIKSIYSWFESLRQNSQKYSLFKSGYHGISLCNAYQIVVIFVTEAITICVPLCGVHISSFAFITATPLEQMCIIRGYVWIWKSLCYALLLLLFFIDTQTRANHDHNRRFDRLDLHFPFHLSDTILGDKTIKLGFDLESIVRLASNVLYCTC